MLRERSEVSLLGNAISRANFLLAELSFALSTFLYHKYKKFN
jgi:hypothetical protein